MLNILRYASAAATAAADLLYPPHCLACGRDTGNGHAGGLCMECRDSISFICGPACARCSSPVGHHARTGGCPHCTRKNFAFTGAAAAGRYDGLLRELVLQLKYGHRPVLARPLGALMAARVRGGDAAGMDLVVPVPLHRKKFRERGFNQAELLARRVASRLHLALRNDVLLRTKDTQAQTGLDRSSRRKNVEKAFAVRNGADIRGARILLVDDVMTTGSTLSECASALKRAGASKVEVLVAARE